MLIEPVFANLLPSYLVTSCSDPPCRSFFQRITSMTYKGCKSSARTCLIRVVDAPARVLGEKTEILHQLSGAGQWKEDLWSGYVVAGLCSWFKSLQAECFKACFLNSGCCDIIPRHPIPRRLLSDGQDSKLPRVRGDKIPRGTSFQGAMSPRGTWVQRLHRSKEIFPLKRVQGT